MLQAVGRTITVGSVAVTVPLVPPPLAVAVLMSGEVAFGAISTVTVIGGKLEPAGSTSPRLHPVRLVLVAQSHPVPAIEATVIPAGGCSKIWTIPAPVGPVPTLLIVKVYTPCCPATKLPV
jgi:hypothetical protein